MENASKALLIAGGILLAMLVTAMLFLLNSNIQSFKSAQSEKAYQEELVAFNRQFEAYNKKIMYGTDVISVVNKAIANNNLMDVQADPENAYYVNIQFTIIKNMEETIETTVEDSAGVHDPNSESINDTVKLPIGTYNLGQMTLDGNFEMYDNIVDFFAEEAKPEDPVVTIDPHGIITTKIKYPAIINFKRSIFTCPNGGVHYNENTGRIDRLTFIQVKEK